MPLGYRSELELRQENGFERAEPNGIAGVRYWRFKWRCPLRKAAILLLAALVFSACDLSEPGAAPDSTGSESVSRPPASSEPASPTTHPIVFAGILGEGTELFTLDLADQSRHQLTSLAKYLGFPVWSPAGDRIAFIAMTEETADLMLLDVQSGEVSVLLAGYNELADWGPRGERLLVGLEEGLHFLEVATGNTEKVDTGSDADAYGRWARDAALIAYESNRDGNPEIYVTHLETGETTRLTENADLDEWPSLSRDGGYVAWASGTEEDKNLWVMRSDGSEKRQVTEGMLFGDAFPEWSPDGTQILLTVNEDDVFVLKLIDLESGGVTHLGEGAAASWR